MGWITEPDNKESYYIKDKLIGSIIYTDNIYRIELEYGVALDTDLSSAKETVELSAYLIPGDAYQKH